MVPRPLAGHTAAAQPRQAAPLLPPTPQQRIILDAPEFLVVNKPHSVPAGGPALRRRAAMRSRIADCARIAPI